jgi:hypothetical protein
VGDNLGHVKAKLGQPSAANSVKAALEALWLIWMAGHAEENHICLRV